MSEPLSTLAISCRHQQDIRKSRFLAQAAPVTTPEHALAFVRDVSDTTATHNCWSYRIGQDYRFNDDGEPGGTAGRPILQAIEGQRMDRVAVVVTRWYGGIKLGAGGLARAYGGCTSECLRIAERLPIVAMTSARLHCEFAELPLIKSRLKELDAVNVTERFDGDGVVLHLQLPLHRQAEAQARITDLTRGRATLTDTD
jgi:uncharacterized YigZ family protein